jgi:calcineurin-like phosphoesterase family protein
MKVYLTADLHLGHSNIIAYCNRPFLTDVDKKISEECTLKQTKFRPSWESTEMMNNNIIDNINKTVRHDDQLWILGDFCFARHDYFNTARNYRNKINCKNVSFVFGNHDRYEIGKLFNYACDFLETTINGQRFVFCHYALAIWPHSHHGAIHCYGHSHSSAEPWLDKIMPNRRSIDVGIDNAARLLEEYRPFSFDEIMKIVGNQAGFYPDHHKEP